jgi:hypothetical protein
MFPLSDYHTSQPSRPAAPTMSEEQGSEMAVMKAQLVYLTHGLRVATLSRRISEPAEVWNGTGGVRTVSGAVPAGMACHGLRVATLESFVSVAAR